MRQKSFLKDLTRSIFRTKARFLSIMAIIALGVGFFAGINATEPDMVLSADKYYKDYSLSDFRLISPLGFKASDIENVQQTPGVAKVQGSYTKDLFLTTKAGSTTTVRAFSYDANDYLGQDGLNKPVLIAGRMPEKAGEIAIEEGMNVPGGINGGSTLTVTLPNGELLSDSLKTDTYTLVGLINSPMYINFERGQTNIGDGSIGYFAYIAETDFAMEKVTDLFVRTSASQNLIAYSDEYKNHLTPVEAAFEILGKDTMASETRAFQDELDNGKAELLANKEKAEKELADGEKKLQDAATSIVDGEKTLQENDTRYTKELADQRVLLENGRAELDKGRKLYTKNYALWLKGYNTYKDGLRQMDTAKAQLDAADDLIIQGETQLVATRSQLDIAKGQIDQLQASIAGLNGISSTLAVRGSAMNEVAFNQLIADTRIYSTELAETIAQGYRFDDPELLMKLEQSFDMTIARLENIYSVSKKEYDDGLAKYMNGSALLAENKVKYEKGLAEYQTGLAKLSASKPQIDSGKTALDKAKVTINENQAKMDTGEAALIKGEADLKIQLAEGRQKLADARIELAEGTDTYETEKADALQKIADAEVTIQDSERKIIQIPDQWFVFTRDGNPGYSGYGDDAKRIGAVAKVFPLFFFLVAALVCLTTMTRMVEEERIQIGTLKALGYSTLTISSKYLIYALLASLFGAMAGLIVGFRLFPGIIMNAYGIMYQIPVRMTPDHPVYAVISIFIAVVTTVTASLLAAIQELRATPAVLMQPKAPKPGKRILLERIQPIWKRMSFSYKVTARNIFRYKRRFLMTVIGIAGCTALLVTGFGLRDSINAIMGKQFDEIFIYDAQLMVNTGKSESERNLLQILGNHPEVKTYLSMLNETVSALPDGSSRTFEATLVVPEDVHALPDFYDLHERTSRKKLGLSDEGAVVTEKLASLLHVRTGDTLTYRDSENITYQVQVSGIAENYLSHFIYLSPGYFAKINNRTPQFNSAVFNFKNAATVNQNAFKAELLSHEGILGAMFTQSIAKNFNDTIKNLNYVVLILILSAGALAFVVLYNLTNINITERIREIATIKVLGFRDKEVSAYVYRENVILTLIGTFCGLLMGFVMHRFVMSTMEIDTMMFGKNIQFISYLLSVALTMAFSTLVNIFMFYHLRKVNLVESLKSIE